MDFLMPPVEKNAQGDMRHVGFELEFSDIELDRIVEAIQELFGGTINRKSTFSYTVDDTRYGTFAVDLDAAQLRDKFYLEMLEKIGISGDATQSFQNIEKFLLKTASTVVPFEIGTPPIPLSDLSVVDEMRQVLCERDARGTRRSFFYAFGLHINPEVPSQDTKHVLNYLRAFLLLYEWICEMGNIDLARRLTPFIDPFPDDYVQRVLNPGYAPDQAAFVRDYLHRNPTRYRPLDLLPLFMWMDPSFFDAWDIDAHRISARPTFHYRLPNCLIDDTTWRIARAWNDWVLVERLAEDEDRLKTLCERFIEQSMDDVMLTKWSDRVREWIG